MGASAQKCLDFGCVLTNRLPAPGIFSSCTTFQLCSLNLACSGLSDAVDISDTTSSPRWPVAHTGPHCLCTNLAPRPGSGILLFGRSSCWVLVFHYVFFFVFVFSLN